MSGNEALRYPPGLESSELLSMAGATLGSLSPGDVKRFTVALHSKSEQLMAMVKDTEDFTEESLRSFLGRFLASRRHARSILAANRVTELTAAVKSLRVSRLEPSVSIQRFSSLKGAGASVLEDVAFEAIHFLNPDMFGLCTRWVFNPVNAKGALAPAVHGKVRPDFASRQSVVRQAKEILDAAGFVFPNFYGLDIACSLAYAGGIMGAKDTSMNSGGMEALFPNSTVLAAMILGIRREIIAHT